MNFMRLPIVDRLHLTPFAPHLGRHIWVVPLASLAVAVAACGNDGGGASGESGINLTEGMASGSSSANSSLDSTAGMVTGSGDDLPDGCEAVNFELEYQPTNVVLVLDKSFSMVDPNNLWDHDSDEATPNVTRWNSLYNVVNFLVEEFDNGLNFGAVMFPAIDVPDNEWQTACDVQLEPNSPVGSLGGQAVLEAIPGPDDVELYGGTPAREGIATGLNHLRTLGAELPRAMILITDGAANCLAGTIGGAVFDLYDENLPALVSEAYQVDEIPTFVVGIDIRDEFVSIPMDNPFERLNEVAIAGGFPRPGNEKFHNATDEEELRTAVSQIASQVGCNIPVDPIPEIPEILRIFINGEELFRVEDCEGTDDGWRYVNPDGPYDEIELCSNSCDALHNAGTISAIYECIVPG